jgi:HlyD family secretion protein
MVKPRHFLVIFALIALLGAVVEIKQAALQTAQTNLSYCRIVSPMDGIVISRNINVGNSVAASLSSPTLFEIGNDLGQMQIDAAVAEADVGKIRVGQPVNLSVDAYLNRTFHGVVYQVRNAPQTQQNVVSYDVMIKVPNADLALKPGMTATVSIVVARRSRVLRISNNALNFHLPGGKKTHPINEGAFCSVYRLRAAGTPALVRVKVGITDGVYTEAVGPLNPGDQLITGIDAPVEPNTPNMSSPFSGSSPGRF